MKTARLLFILLLPIGLVLSCVPKKKFLAEQNAKHKAQQQLAEARKENQQLSKRIEELLSDTTKLGDNIRKLMSEKSALTTEKAKLTQDVEGLKKRYDDLKISNALTTEELRSRLNDKEEELAKKEKELEEREKLVNELKDAISKKEKALQSLLDKVNKSLIGFNPDELSVEKKNGKIYVSLAEKLLFQSGRTNIGSKGQDALVKLAEVLNKNPEIDVVIEGHTDDVPIKTSVFTDNWDLSVMRATSIVRILTKEGEMDPKRITPSGRGEHYPVATNETKDGKAKNRRVEIILSPKLDELMKILEGKKE